MKRLIAYFIFAFFGVLIMDAVDFADETLHYKVMFKWGLINKQAGSVAIRLENHPDKYVGRLTAASAPWADKFYRVRDTLNCTINKDGFEATFYEKISHEGSEDKHDIVRYRREGSTVIGECTRLVKKNGKITKDEKRTLQAIGTTVDMLTSFYYMRNLPFDDWKKDYVVTINIFSGKRKELLTIKYLGQETVKYEGKSFPCHHISFIFTSDGSKKTSDDMDAWITTTPDRIPVKLEGKLPVGKVKCFYTG